MARTCARMSVGVDDGGDDEGFIVVVVRVVVGTRLYEVGDW